MRGLTISVVCETQTKHEIIDLWEQGYEFSKYDAKWLSKIN